MKRLKAAGEEFAQIQPAESEASSKSGPIVSVSGPDQVRLTKKHHLLTKLWQLLTVRVHNASAQTTWQKYCLGGIYVATPDDFRTLPVDCTEAVLSLWVCVVLLPFSFLHAQQQRQRAAAYALHLPFYIWQSIWTYGTVIEILISFCLFHPSLKIMLYMFYNLKSFRLKQTV